MAKKKTTKLKEAQKIRMDRFLDNKKKVTIALNPSEYRLLTKLAKGNSYGYKGLVGAIREWLHNQK